MADVKKATKNLELHPSLRDYEPAQKAAKSKATNSLKMEGFMPASKLLTNDEIKRGGWDKEVAKTDEVKKAKSSGGFKLKRETERQTNIKSFFSVPTKGNEQINTTTTKSKPKSEKVHSKWKQLGLAFSESDDGDGDVEIASKTSMIDSSKTKKENSDKKDGAKFADTLKGEF